MARRILEFEIVSRCFAGRPPVWALRDVTFIVSTGELIMISGSSGSGKTTLLNIAGGLQEVTSGNVLVNGRTLSRISSGERNRLHAEVVSFVFQSPSLIPVLTARENIDYVLRLTQTQLTSKERERSVEEALELTGLTARARSLPAQMSGGECQRLAIARAVVKRPALLLADEPTSHLDDTNAATVADLLEFLSHAHSTTVLVATHDNRVLSRGHRTLQLSDGHLITDFNERLLSARK